jgi:hypothetical protein
LAVNGTSLTSFSYCCLWIFCTLLKGNLRLKGWCICFTIVFKGFVFASKFGCVVICSYLRSLCFVTLDKTWYIFNIILNNIFHIVIALSIREWW